jgi:hypothetical protein
MYPEQPRAIIGPLRPALLAAALVGILAACQPAGTAGTGPSSPGKIQQPTAEARCIITRATPGILERTGTGPPAPGYRWGVLRCPGMNKNAVGGALIQLPVRNRAPRKGRSYCRPDGDRSEGRLSCYR